MAKIDINIPDAVLPRVLDAFAAAYGYNAEKDGTKAEFAKAQVVRFVMEIVRANEVEVVVSTARKAAVTKAEKEVVIS